MTLVDGSETDCQVLFEHPNAPLLIVRSTAGGTLQSVPTAMVQKATTGGKEKKYSATRKLTADEKKALEADGLWGDAVGEGQIGAYANQKWQAAPVIVWAKPGESADGLKADSWLDETGKPLAAAPFEALPPNKRKSAQNDEAAFDGDVLVPRADKPYEVLQAGNRDHLGMVRVRHLTVERNASYQIRYNVSGNLWLKDGGDLGRNTQTGCFGARENNWHTVVRICGDRWPRGKAAAKNGESEGVDLSHWLYFDSGDKGSVEFVGISRGSGDRLTVERGTLIVSEDSYVGNGERASFFSKPGTTVILLDGARIGSQSLINADSRATIGIGGHLSIGTPQRPIEKDFVFLGSVVNFDKIQPDITPNQRTAGASFVIGSTGSMAVHTADPAKARLILRPFPEGTPYSQYALRKGDTLPTGIGAVFMGKTDFNGVVFDGFYKNGIIVSDAARKKWKNVTFGDKNQGQPEELFRNP